MCPPKPKIQKADPPAPPPPPPVQEPSAPTLNELGPDKGPAPATPNNNRSLSNRRGRSSLRIPLIGQTGLNVPNG